MRVNRGEVERVVSSVSANYVKRWLEGNFYDWLFATEPALWAKTLDPATKYVIEAGLYLAASQVVRVPVKPAPLASIAYEVLSDAAPEIAKRLINGDASLATKTAEPDLTPHERSIIETWLAETSDAERDAFLGAMLQNESPKVEGVGREERRPDGSTRGDEARSESAPATGVSTLTERVRARRLRLQAKRRERRRVP